MMRTLERTRSDLAAFLRAHRERLSPADVGLPSGGRRRTPGLRREEVAALAGVGLTWYTWLEQGRDMTLSDAAEFDGVKSERILFGLNGTVRDAIDGNDILLMTMLYGR